MNAATEINTNEQGIVTTKNDPKALKAYFKYLLFTALLTPQFAMAQIGEDFLEEIVDLLTSTWARLVAIIAVAVAGYMFMFTKQIEKEMFFKIAGGIFLIFGAATIVDELSGWVD
jgi:type IV secretory pathway VirB2 component (pilin)